MDTKSLLHVEEDLRQQNKVVDKHIASLHGRIEQGIEKQHIFEKAFMKLESGRDWESRQKVNKEKELTLAKAEVQTKRDQMASISAHADEVRSQVRVLEDKMLSLKNEKEYIEAHYAKPTILDVVDGKLNHLGPISHRILNKTLHTLLFPGISSGVAGVDRLRQHMRGSTQHVAIVSTLTIYGFLVCLVWLVFRAYRRITGRLTLSRMIFTADMTFSAFWAFLGVWSIALLEDPIAIMRHHSEPMLVGVQLIMAFVILCFIFIRCVSLSATLQGIEGLELVACLVIVQHYCQAVWTPSLTDGDTNVGAEVYLGYGLGHLILAARRARSQVLCKHSKEGTSRAKGLLKNSDQDSETGVAWLSSQMRLVALAIEAMLFTVSPRPDPITTDSPRYRPDEQSIDDNDRQYLHLTENGESDDNSSEY